MGESVETSPTDYPVCQNTLCGYEYGNVPGKYQDDSVLRYFYTKCDDGKRTYYSYVRKVFSK